MEKILIVDDEIETCNAMKDFFITKDFEVHTAIDGQSALKIMKEENPHIVLLDLIMPDMHGIEILKQIKMINSETAVIIVTAVFDENLGNQLIQSGAYDYITKPVDLENLESVVMLKILDLIDNS